MSDEMEDTMRTISEYKGVIGVVLVNDEGIPIKSTVNNALSVQYAGQMRQLVARAMSAVKNLDPTNDLTCLRVKTKNYEIMAVPDPEFLLIVVQDHIT